MKKIRLSPNQTKRLIDVYQNWSKCFINILYLPHNKGLTRQPTPEELTQHWSNKVQELADIESQILDAVEARQFGAVKDLAELAEFIEEDLAKKDESTLVCLTDKAVKYAQVLITNL